MTRLARSVVAVVLAWIAAALSTTPRALDRHYSTWQVDGRFLCLVSFSTWVTTLTPGLYFNLFFWWRVVAVQCLPCILVTFTNCCLVRSLTKAR